MSKDIRNLVAAFVQDLEGLIRQEILQALASSGPKTKSKAPAKPKRQTRLAAEKRSPKQMESMRAKVLAFAARTPGQRSEDMQKALKLGPLDLALPLRQLLDAKLLRAEGAARGRRYWANGNGV